MIRGCCIGDFAVVYVCEVLVLACTCILLYWTFTCEIVVEMDRFCHRAAGMHGLAS
jgi:hypothetical protein